MYKRKGYKEIKSFTHRGVTIFVPEGHEDIVAYEKDLTWKEHMRTVEPKFKPHRLVIDIKIDGAQVLKSLDPVPILRVYFTHDDLKDILNIKLAYWIPNEWHVIQVAPETLADNQIWAGYFDVEIDDWIDPPIALGS